MNRGALIGAAAIVLSAQAAAADYVLTISAIEPQVTRMESGTKIVDSSGPNTGVRVVQPKGPTEPRARVAIFVYNRSGKPFNFGPENVRLRYGGGKSVRMMTYDELATEERKKHKRKAAMLALFAGLGGAAASDAGDYSGTAHVDTSRYGSADITYSGTNNAASYAAVQDAAREARENREALDARYAERLAMLDAVMQTTTVDPGKVFGGIVHFSGPKDMERTKGSYPIVLEVTAGEDTHIILGTLLRD